MAAVAAPVCVISLGSGSPDMNLTHGPVLAFVLFRMGPVSDVMVSSLGDSILVELGMHAGFDLATSLANDMVYKKPLNYVLPIHSSRLETTGVKVLLITLKHKHIVGDAALGFFRSSIHR